MEEMAGHLFQGRHKEHVRNKIQEYLKDELGISETDMMHTVSLDGVELALLIASNMANSWPFRLTAPRERLSERELLTSDNASAYLYELHKDALITAGAFLPSVDQVPPPEYVHIRAMIQVIAWLTPEEISSCQKVLKFCYEELKEDPVDWRDFCSIAQTMLEHFHLEVADLLRLAGKLGEALHGSPVERQRLEGLSKLSQNWLPTDAIEIYLNGVEVALLKGSVSLVNGWVFQSSAASAFMDSSAMAMMGPIANYLFGERKSFLRSVGASLSALTPGSQESIAKLAELQSRHVFLPEHVRVCVAAMRACEIEFQGHWIDFYETARSGLQRFYPAPEELPSLIHKLERLIGAAPMHE